MANKQPIFGLTSGNATSAYELPNAPHATTRKMVKTSCITVLRDPQR